MREDSASWGRFFRGMIERGLRDVRLVVGDRSAGLVSTVNSMLPKERYQRYMVHFMRSVLSRRPRAAANRLREGVGETAVPAAGVPGRAPQTHPHEQHVLWAGFSRLAVLPGFGVVSPGLRRRAAGCWGRSPVGADIVVARWLHLPYGLLSCG